MLIACKQGKRPAALDPQAVIQTRRHHRPRARQACSLPCRPITGSPGSPPTLSRRKNSRLVRETLKLRGAQCVGRNFRAFTGTSAGYAWHWGALHAWFEIRSTSSLRTAFLSLVGVLYSERGGQKV